MDQELMTPEEHAEEQQQQQQAQQEQTQEEVTEPQTQEWEPNYSYSVRDDQFEFDEWARPFIKDAETEENMRQLYTKAGGLDRVKQSLEKTSTELTTAQQEALRHKEEAELARKGYDNMANLAKEDFAAFAGLVGLDDKTILNYANQRLDYREKPEWERQQIDRDVELRTKSYESQVQTEMLRKENERLMRVQHEEKFSQALNQPEIKAFAEKFDGRLGKGSFEQHVKEYGSNEFRTNKRYVEPMISAQQVYAKWRPLFEDALDKVNKEETKTSATTIPKAPTNLGEGRAGSVVRKRIKSIDDLRKISNELARKRGTGY